MRVGFITPALRGTSGWGRYALDLIAALGALRVEAVVIAPIDAPASIDVPHIAYHRILNPLISGQRWVTPRALMRAPRVRRLVRSCDLVHCTGELFIPLAAFLGKPLIITAHGTYLPRAARRRIVGRLFAWAVRRARAVICVSRYTEAQVKAALPDARTVVIHNGVHWQRFMTPSVPSPPEPKHGPVILGVGQLKQRKGFHIVAQAMQTVRRRYPNAAYIIIGDDTNAPGLSAELNAMPGVRTLGRVDDAVLRAWYHHADLMAQTPVTAHDKFEGFGLIYLEAGAAGLTSVGARGSGAQEAILHGQTGLLVPQGDPDATADAILRLLDDDALRARLAEGAYRHAKANGWAQKAAQVLEVYQAREQG